VDLTPKQEKFANLYVELGNAAEAYRRAYSSKAKPETLYPRASNLLASAKVSARVRELRKQLEKTSLWSREQSVKVLAEIAQGDDEAAKPNDRIAAVREINRMHGWEGEPEKEEKEGITITVTRAGE